MTDTDIQTQPDEQENETQSFEEPNEQVSDPSTEQEEHSESQPDEHAGVQKRINQFKLDVHNERRAKEAAERELKAFKDAQPKEVRPDVPDVPDAFDDNFEQNMKARDEAQLRAAEFDARERFLVEQEQASQARLQVENNVKMRETYQGFIAKGSEAGISPDELQKAGQTIAQFGITEGIANDLLTSENGSLIAAYLGREPLALEGMRGMTEIQASRYLDNEILPKAKAAFTKPNTPDPIDSLDGAGVSPSDGMKHAAGGTFS